MIDVNRLNSEPVRSVRKKLERGDATPLVELSTIPGMIVTGSTALTFQGTGTDGRMVAFWPTTSATAESWLWGFVLNYSSHGCVVLFVVSSAGGLIKNIRKKKNHVRRRSDMSPARFDSNHHQRIPPQKHSPRLAAKR